MTGPIADALVAPVGRLQFDCVSETNVVTGAPTAALTAADGSFSIAILEGDGPGDHCIDLSVSSSSLGTSAILRVAATFVPVASPPDTTDVLLNVTW